MGWAHDRLIKQIHIMGKVMLLSIQRVAVVFMLIVIPRRELKKLKNTARIGYFLIMFSQS